LTPVKLTRQASADIEKTAAWYEGQKEGLGIAFVDRVLEAVDTIAQNPKGYRKRIEDVRMAAVPKFPYGLWFRVVPEDGSIVIACLHHKRDVRLAKERALGITPIRDPS
jgi:plasmid stabilization system protein ParE